MFKKGDLVKLDVDMLNEERWRTFFVDGQPNRGGVINRVPVYYHEYNAPALDFHNHLHPVLESDICIYLNLVTVKTLEESYMVVYHQRLGKKLRASPKRVSPLSGRTDQS